MALSLNAFAAFRAVAQAGSFSRAARSLGVTQPAISQQIASLQKALDLHLIDTVRNRVQLTEAGHFILERIEAMLDGVASLERDAREFAAAARGTLHLAATLTIGTYVLPDLLAEYLRERSGVRPHIELANSVSVAQLVRSGAVALGLIEGLVDDPALERTVFAHDRLTLVVPPTHRFARRHHVAIEELANEAFVSRESGSGTRDLGYDALRERGVTPPIALELPNGGGIVRAVEAGIGIAILSERVVARAVQLRRVRTVAIDDFPAMRDFSFIRRKDRTPAPATQAFIRMLIDGKALHMVSQKDAR